MSEELCDHVLYHTEMGGRRMDDSLGIQRMPKGYALMLNCDESHFYWLRHDGAESCIHWNKWAVYRGARADAEDNKEDAEDG